MTENTKSKESHVNQPIIQIGHDYILKHCIYRGQTHNIYLAYSISKQYTYFIIRLINQNVEAVQHEEKMLKKLENTPGIPALVGKGEERIQSTNYHYTVFEKYGPSIKLCHKFVNNHFTLPTICMIAISTLNVLEKLHHKLLVHRNLKPKKILTSLNQSTKFDFYLIDYKYATKYRRKNGVYLGTTESKKFQNKQFLNKYSSLNTHLGLACSPKDDLESLGYILIYFLSKSIFINYLIIIQENVFPKEGKSKEEKLKSLEDWKVKLIPEKHFKDIPHEVQTYFQYIKMTNVTQFPFPDYEFLKKLFRSILQRFGISDKEFSFDWQHKMRDLNLQQNPQVSQWSQNPENQSNNQNKPEIPEILNEEENETIINKQNLTVGGFDDDDNDDDTASMRMFKVNVFSPKFKNSLKTN